MVFIMLFVAEIGLNHNGNFMLALEMIRQARRAGADIAKFQLGWRGAEDEINHITPEILESLVRRCDFEGIEPMVSVFTPEAYELAKPFKFDKYKIASRTVKDHPDLVRSILAEGKKTFVSLGMWDGEDVPFPDYDNAQYLWCVSRYPTNPWDLTKMPAEFTSSPYVGYSDHTLGIESALLAVARGASVIEKHFTLDKSDTTIRDHAMSATPEEFALMVELGHAMHRTLKACT